MFARVIVVDFSASSSVGPARESPDRCWLAWADVGAVRGVSQPEYFRTRGSLESRLVEVIGSCAGGVLVGVDFPIGYPCARDGRAVLPTGRELTALMHSLVRDEADGTNNRFDVAAELNRRIQTLTGAAEGPFWGHPAGRAYADLGFRRPGGERTGVMEFRPAEEELRGRGWAIQSAWKLAGAGCVGGQAVLGLAMVERVARAAGPRSLVMAGSWMGSGHETAEALAPREGVVVCEVWPSLCGGAVDAVDHPIKDARQVVACCAAMVKG
jgi:hypothetical protein